MEWGAAQGLSFFSSSLTSRHLFLIKSTLWNHYTDWCDVCWTHSKIFIWDFLLLNFKSSSASLKRDDCFIHRPRRPHNDSFDAWDEKQNSFSFTRLKWMSAVWKLNGSVSVLFSVIGFTAKVLACRATFR